MDEVDPVESDALDLATQNKLLRKEISVLKIGLIVLALLFSLGVLGVLRIGVNNGNTATKAATAATKATSASKDTAALAERLLPLVSPEALAASKRTGDFYADFLTAICSGQNAQTYEITARATVVCKAPEKP